MTKKTLTMEHISLSYQGSVGILTLDVPDQSMNVLSRQSMSEIEAMLKEVESDSDLSGVVLLSGKADSFIAGADVEMLDACDSVEEASKLARRGQAIFKRIESLNIPFVAAIHGICLGGGLELALACHYRICSDDEKTQLGLPEVKLGLLPGSGGTQRLPRLINLQTALDMMLTGKQLRAKQALKQGLVDAMVAEPILLEVALKYIEKGMPDRRQVKRNVLGKLLEKNSFGRSIIFDQALKAVEKKTFGNYPAPSNIIQAVRVGLENGTAQGYELEARLFGSLTQTQQSKQLRQLFFASTALKKTHTSELKPKKISKAAVLGGGLMGGGIAYVTATKANVPVRIKDISQEGISAALAYSYKLLNQKVKRRFIKPMALQKEMAKITGSTEFVGIKDADIVVEAVFEDLKVKQTVLYEIEQHCSEQTIFASNTSSLPIKKIAEHAERPENVIGLHYFSPVDKMPLAEVIVHEGTSEQTISTVVNFARKQGKTPIVVKDGAGFYVNRILALYLNEAANLLLAGEPIERIDRSLVRFGFPVGPLKLLDEVGIDIGSKICPILSSDLGGRFNPPEVFDALIEDERFGKKNKSGFYLYKLSNLDKLLGRKSGKKVDPALYDLLNIVEKPQLNEEELVERCLIQMLNEAARCLEEGIIASARDGDIGAIFGIGFPPYLGGPFRYIDSLGADHLVSLLKSCEARFGKRFEPCDLLLEMAESGDTFYEKVEPRHEDEQKPEPGAVQDKEDTQSESEPELAQEKEAPQPEPELVQGKEDTQSESEPELVQEKEENPPEVEPELAQEKEAPQPEIKPELTQEKEEPQPEVDSDKLEASKAKE